MIIEFTMPGDQDFDQAFWDRMGTGPGWDKLADAFEAAGAEVEDTENITIEFKKRDEKKVREVLARVRAGEFGADAATYWNAAKEIASE